MRIELTFTSGRVYHGSDESFDEVLTSMRDAAIDAGEETSDTELVSKILESVTSVVDDLDGGISKMGGYKLNTPGGGVFYANTDFIESIHIVDAETFALDMVAFSEELERKEEMTPPNERRDAMPDDDEDINDANPYNEPIPA